MSRFERASSIDDATIVSRYDRPTTHSAYLQTRCLQGETKSPSFDVFRRMVRARGIDVDRHASLVRRAYDDLVPSDEGARDAIAYVVRNSKGTTRRSGALGSSMPSQYERRENGFEEDLAHEGALARTIG